MHDFWLLNPCSSSPALQPSWWFLSAEQIELWAVSHSPDQFAFLQCFSWPQCYWSLSTVDVIEVTSFQKCFSSTAFPAALVKVGTASSSYTSKPLYWYYIMIIALGLVSKLQPYIWWFYSFIFLNVKTIITTIFFLSLNWNSLILQRARIFFIALMEEFISPHFSTQGQV